MVQIRQSDNPPDVVEIIAQQLQNIIPNIVTQVTNNLNNANGNGNGGGNNGCTYKGFVACGPRDFDGTGGAVALTRWIEKMESVVDNSGCLANQRVKYALSSFIGKALTWWNTQVQARSQDAANAMAWNDFKPLLTTCSHLVTPEAKRVIRYINGLSSQIYGMLRATQPATIQATILTAGIVTDEAVRSSTLAKAGEKRKERDEASKSESVGKDKKKAKGGRGFIAAVPPRRENRNFPKCARCKVFFMQKKDHAYVFYNLPKPSHHGQECRATVGHCKPIQQLGLEKLAEAVMRCGSWITYVQIVYSGTENDPNVVMGTYSLNNLYATVLFDSGADFSFISTKFAHLLNAKPSIANPGYVIEVANGRKEEVDRIFHGLYLKKEVTTYVQGEHNVRKTKTLMSTKANEPTLSDIPIVRDFEDVFLNDLSRLPPQRQVEFRIDLIPRATPVAKSPYRLAPLERQELSEQLQELQDKGFIRQVHTMRGEQLFVCQEEG
ncbi:putative reverse transcriptase domain-containing protein [Tanacetum coccineum]